MSDADRSREFIQRMNRFGLDESLMPDQNAVLAVYGDDIRAIDANAVHVNSEQTANTEPEEERPVNIVDLKQGYRSSLLEYDEQFHGAKPREIFDDQTTSLINEFLYFKNDQASTVTTQAEDISATELKSVPRLHLGGGEILHDNRNEAYVVDQLMRPIRKSDIAKITNSRIYRSRLLSAIVQNMPYDSLVNLVVDPQIQEAYSDTLPRIDRKSREPYNQMPHYLRDFKIGGYAIGKIENLEEFGLSALDKFAGFSVFLCADGLIRLHGRNLRDTSVTNLARFPNKGQVIIPGEDSESDHDKLARLFAIYAPRIHGIKLREVSETKAQIAEREKRHADEMRDFQQYGMRGVYGSRGDKGPG